MKFSKTLAAAVLICGTTVAQASWDTPFNGENYSTSYTDNNGYGNGSGNGSAQGNGHSKARGKGSFGFGMKMKADTDMDADSQWRGEGNGRGNSAADTYEYTQAASDHNFRQTRPYGY